MDRAVQIEMYVPGAWFTFLKQKMQNCLASSSFVKAAGGVFVIGHQPREVPSPCERRLDHGPGLELQTHAALAVDVCDSLDDVPQSLRLHTVHKKQHCLLLVEGPGIKRGCVRRRAPQARELSLQEFACTGRQILPFDHTLCRSRFTHPWKLLARGSRVLRPERRGTSDPHPGRGC